MTVPIIIGSPASIISQEGSLHPVSLLDLDSGESEIVGSLESTQATSVPDENVVPLPVVCGVIWSSFNEDIILIQPHLQLPPHGLCLITPCWVLSVTMSRGLRSSQVGELLRNRSFQHTVYLDDVTFTWFNNRVEEFADLDKAMGTDDGENFNYNGNLDT